jgi:hypothetical protein
MRRWYRLVRVGVLASCINIRVSGSFAVKIHPDPLCIHSECHALTPRGKAFPHEEAAPVAHRLSSFMVPFALVNPVRTTR